MAVPNHHPDVFVIGGGPAGLALAMAVRRKGMSVTVADGDRPPIDKACGEGLMPDGLTALRGVGMSIDFDEGYAFRGIRFLQSEISVDASFPEGSALGMQRTVLHRKMVEQAALAGVRMLWRTPVEGISSRGVVIGRQVVPCKWIVGADGGSSRVRSWAGLDSYRRDEQRFGFRQHYRVNPWTDYMELHWGSECQIYVTPVAREEVCVAVISPNQYLRLADALAQFPELGAHLEKASVITGERGAVTATRQLKAVCRDRVALLGDASGSVDAITGEGLCLAFQQAVILAGCLVAGDLERYQTEHRRLFRRPSMMSDLMLTLSRRNGLRRRVFRAMTAKPRLFDRMLAMHVGALSPLEFATNAVALGWQMLNA